MQFTIYFAASLFVVFLTARFLVVLEAGFFSLLLAFLAEPVVFRVLAVLLPAFRDFFYRPTS